MEDTFVQSINFLSDIFGAIFWRCKMTNEQLDTLAWALEFMRKYELKHPKSSCGMFV